MTQAEQKAEDRPRELDTSTNAATALTHLHARIAPHFRRSEIRQRVCRFMKGLLAPIERKNGWQLAEELQEQGPQGLQRLLNAAHWDAEAVRDTLRAYVLEQLGDEHGVLVIDETGFLKKGTKSAGVARQYSGTAGRRENVQIGVFLLYASPRGYAFIDRALYLPEEWTQDRVRCRAAGIPDEVDFATKGELAQHMLERAFAHHVPAEWIVGDTVYGYDEMRDWLEGQQRNYVLAVPETHTIWSHGEPQPVGLLAALLPAEAWRPLSAGPGSQGPRMYEWAWLHLPYERVGVEGRTAWLLIRRSLTDPSERAYYRVWGPTATPLSRLVTVAGSRWMIEVGFEQAKGEVGLDHYEVRTWTAWLRFTTLALLVYAFLVLIRMNAQAEEQTKEQRTPPLQALTVPEVRRLLHAGDESDAKRALRLRWSRFRRRHQASAHHCHAARRACQQPTAAEQVALPIRVEGLRELTPLCWEHLRPFLPQAAATGRLAGDHRLVVEAILWVMRTGSSWRALPAQFGPWQTVASRYHRWYKEGRWAHMLQVLRQPELPLTSSA